MFWPVPQLGNKTINRLRWELVSHIETVSFVNFVDFANAMLLHFAHDNASIIRVLPRGVVECFDDFHATHHLQSYAWTSPTQTPGFPDPNKKWQNRCYISPSKASSFRQLLHYVSGESIFLSRVEGRGFHVEDQGYHIEGNFFVNFFTKKMCCCCCCCCSLIKIVRGHSNSLKSKEPSPFLWRQTGSA